MNRDQLEQAFISIEEEVRALTPHLARKGLAGKIERFLYGLRRYGPKALLFLCYLSPSVITARTFFGKAIRVNVPENVYVAFFGALPEDELPLTRFLIRELEEDSVFYDIGAQIGFFSLLAREIITSGEIHAFEPNPRTFGILRSNLPFATVNQVLVSDREGEAAFFADLRGSSGTSSAKVRNDGYARITVGSRTLDDYVLSHAAPTIAKIDVEGLEREVIAGGRAALEGATLVMEVWDDPEHIAVARSLIEEGYVMHAISPDGTLSPSSDFSGIRGMANFVFRKAASVSETGMFRH